MYIVARLSDMPGRKIDKAIFCETGRTVTEPDLAEARNLRVAEPEVTEIMPDEAVTLATEADIPEV